ncbi:hypothetical protein HID58_013282, partial [Brassica napus]
APTSPRRTTEWYREYKEKAKRNFSKRSLIPFDWKDTLRVLQEFPMIVRASVSLFEELVTVTADSIANNL